MKLYATRDSKSDGICNWCELKHNTNEICLWQKPPLKEKCGHYCGVGFQRHERGTLCNAKARRWVGLTLRDVPIGGMVRVKLSCEVELK